MDRVYEWRLGEKEVLGFPREVEKLDPVTIAFRGIRYSNSRPQSESVSFHATADHLTIVVDKAPTLESSINLLDPRALAAVAERAGRIRLLEMPYTLWRFTDDIREVLVAPGKRPFRGYPLTIQGRAVPLAYQPYGPWRLAPQDDPFDLSTRASLILPRRFLRDGRLTDLITDLYNSCRFVDTPMTITAQPGGANTDR